MAVEQKQNNFTRLNYYDGLFLKAQDFTAESDFHIQTRRYLNYLLFNQGVVLTEETALEVSPGEGTNLTVAAGAALVRDAATQQGYEIHLKEELILDLSLLTMPDGSPVPDGSKVYITAEFGKETGFSESGAGGSSGGVLVNKPDRVMEQTVIKADTVSPNENEPKVLLAEVTYNSTRITTVIDKRVWGGLRYEALSEDALARIGAGVPAPVVDDFAPPRGVTGDEIIIEGSNFTGVTDVSFGGVFARKIEINLLNDERIRVVVPTGAATGPVAVTTRNGTGSSTTDFTVRTAAPTLVSIDIAPAGPISLNTETSITLSVTGTFDDASTAVLNNADLAWSSSNSGIAGVAAGVVTGIADGTVTISAVHSGGSSDTVDVTVSTPVAAPELHPTLPFDPQTGSPGDEIRVFGNHFSVDAPTPPAVELIVHQVSASVVPPGVIGSRIPAVSVTLIDDGELTFDVPGLPSSFPSLPGLVRIDMAIAVRTTGGEVRTDPDVIAFRWRP